MRDSSTMGRVVATATLVVMMVAVTRGRGRGGERGRTREGAGARARAMAMAMTSALVMMRRRARARVGACMRGGLAARRRAAAGLFHDLSRLWSHHWSIQLAFKDIAVQLSSIHASNGLECLFFCCVADPGKAASIPDGAIRGNVNVLDCAILREDFVEMRRCDVPREILNVDGGGGWGEAAARGTEGGGAWLSRGRAGLGASASASARRGAGTRASPGARARARAGRVGAALRMRTMHRVRGETSPTGPRAWRRARGRRGKTRG